MALRTFDPSKVTVSVGGVNIGGFADGTFISAERTTESFTKTAGADGDITRVRSVDKSGEITITLAQTSPSNKTLSDFVRDDENEGKGVVALLIKDTSGDTVLEAAFAWVRMPPPVAFGKEIETREWIIDCADLKMDIQGNNAA